MSSPQRVLYFLENSRAIRTAWALEELELPYELKIYRRIQGKGSDAAMKSESRNPLGKSPFLVDGDVNLGESTAQVRYLIERYVPQRGQTDLLGAADNWQERADVDAWISFSQGMMVHSLAAVYPRWFVDQSAAAAIEQKMSADIHNNLNHLERELSKPGARLTAADIMCAMSAEYAIGMDIAISSQGKTRDDWPKTLEWLKGLAKLPSYQRVLEKGGTHKFAILD